MRGGVDDTYGRCIDLVLELLLGPLARIERSPDRACQGGRPNRNSLVQHPCFSSAGSSRTRLPRL